MSKLGFGTVSSVRARTRRWGLQLYKKAFFCMHAAMEWEGYSQERNDLVLLGISRQDFSSLEDAKNFSRRLDKNADRQG